MDKLNIYIFHLIICCSFHQKMKLIFYMQFFYSSMMLTFTLCSGFEFHSQNL